MRQLIEVNRKEMTDEDLDELVFVDNSGDDDVATKCTLNLKTLAEIIKLLVDKVMACNPVMIRILWKVETAARPYLKIQRKLQRNSTTWYSVMVLATNTASPYSNYVTVYCHAGRHAHR
jgi:hypothetical protein